MPQETIIFDILGDRFWSKVDRSGDCWTWNNYVTAKGYGKYKYNGKTSLAHRVSFQTHHGITLTPDQVLLHSCDNPSCVRPSHLKVGTVQENNEDKRIKGRHPIGEKIASAKLSESQVIDIRMLAETNTRRAIAKRFGVAPSTIHKIVKRETWDHV